MSTIPLWMLLLMGCGEGYKPADCDDGEDNDEDGLLDCADPGCADTDLCQSDLTLYINEFMASNDTVIADDDGEFEDWIELYNPTDHEVDLHGWMVTDDLERIDRHVLARGVTLPPQGFLLLWADDDPDAGDDHLEFRLSSTGEFVALHDPWERRVDVVLYHAQTTDLSQARVPDGDDQWREEAEPTPGESNGEL